MARHDDSRAHSAQTPASILVQYVADKGYALDLTVAASLCESLHLPGATDLKKKAKELKAALAAEGIDLKHTNALEIIAQLVGFSSWMRAKTTSSQYRAAVYALQTNIEGIAQAPELFESIGEAVSATLEKAIALISSRTEPAFCALRRSPRSFVLEVSQATGTWFALDVVSLNKEKVLEGSELEFISFQENSLRLALERIVTNIEQARPGALVVYGVIPANLNPCHYAAWSLTSVGSAVQRVVTDERELFLLLEAIGCSAADFAHGMHRFVGTTETFEITRMWVESSGNASTQDTLEAHEIKQLLQRFNRWRSALPGTVANALQAIGSGGRTQGWTVSIDFAKLEAAVGKHNLTVADLAKVASVAYRDLLRIRDYQLAEPELVLKVASALHMSPELLRKDQDTGLGFAVDKGTQLMQLCGGAHGYRVVLGNSITPELEDTASELMRTCTELSDLAAMDKTWADPEGEIQEGGLADAADDVLGQIREAGLRLIIGRDIRFMRSGPPDDTDRGFVAMNTVTFCAERLGAATHAMWHPVGKS
jgi:hypothetical protein